VRTVTLRVVRVEYLSMTSVSEQATPTLPGIEARDEHDLRIWTAVAMWLGGGLAAAAATGLPGTKVEVVDLRVLAGLCALAAIVSVIMFRPASNRRLYLLTNIFSAIGEVGVCFACLWSGGASSGFVGLYFFSVLYGAYFFRRAHAVLHLLLVSALAALPLIYDDGRAGTHFPGRLVVLVVSFWAMYIVIDYRKRRLLFAELSSRRRALSDPLTGLHNLRSLRERAEREELRAGTGLVLMDIDDFKAVNTEYGHLAADELLRALGAGLLELGRERDCVARIGGDEFAMLVFDRTGAEIAALAKGCVPAIGRARRQADLQYGDLSASVGCAVWPQDGSTLTELMATADREMFAVKESRKRAAAQVQAALSSHEERPAPRAREPRPLRAPARTPTRLWPVDGVQPRVRPGSAIRWQRWWSRRPRKSTAAGVIWVGGAAITLATMLVPGADSHHVFAVACLVGAGLVAGVALIVVPASLSEPACLFFDVLAVPGIALAVYLTGGIDSPLLPLVFLAVASAAYFAQPREALMRLLGAVLICASPFAYASGAEREVFVVPCLALVMTAAVLSAVILYSRRELAQAERAADELSRHDSLTGLPNRRAFTDTVSDALAHMSGFPDDLLSLAMIDLDNFKLVNDRHGHAAGDAVLQAIAVELGAVVRQGDCMARIGGDEFALHARGLDESATEALGDRCVRAVEQGVRRAGYSDCGVSATVGFALFPHHGVTLEALLRSADSALMRAKGEGKRQVLSAEVSKTRPREVVRAI
jgi:diguanylate cyclase (GGDEF)-like protein